MPQSLLPSNTFSNDKLVDLYDEMQKVRDLCFFICGALEGILSCELTVEPETINGFRLSSDSLKAHAQAVTQQLRDICESGK